MDHLFPKGCQDFVRKDVGFRVDHIWTDFDVRETFSTSGEIIFHPILNQIPKQTKAKRKMKKIPLEFPRASPILNEAPLTVAATQFNDFSHHVICGLSVLQLLDPSLGGQSERRTIHQFNSSRMNEVSSNTYRWISWPSATFDWFRVSLIDSGPTGVVAVRVTESGRAESSASKA